VETPLLVTRPDYCVAVFSESYVERHHYSHFFPIFPTDRYWRLLEGEPKPKEPSRRRLER
jgi:hypothetical protein